MQWTIEFSETAKKQLKKLDPQTRQRILRYLEDRVQRLDNPRDLGKSLTGSALGDFWRYRVGDYRVIVEIRDNELVVIVVKIGPRDKIYH